MKRIAVFLITLLGTSVLAGCTKNDGSSVAIEGIVEDARGNRISDAKIVITYDDLLSNPDPQSHQLIVFQYPVETEQHIILRVKALPSGEIVRTVVDEVQQAGTYGRLWDLRDDEGKVVRSDLYSWEVLYEDGDPLDGYSLFINIGHYDAYPYNGISAFASTDENGRFTVLKEDLVFSKGALEEATPEFTLDNRITVWAVTEGQGTTSVANVFYEPKSSETESVTLTLSQ